MPAVPCSQCGQPFESLSSEGLCSGCCAKQSSRTINATIAYQGVSDTTVHDTPSFSQRVVGDYELISQIAQGGMGVVYKARQISLNREVALKMVPASSYANEAAKDRFRVEAEAVAALDHSNIIPIYEVGEFQGQPFYSMKLVGKGNLADRLKLHDPRQGVESLIRLLEKVCRAVQHAHERGVIHRDLKPSNILLEKPDQPMLADFGLAKRTGQDATLTGMILGTPRYMAPEQAAGQAKSATTRTDVYSLGVMLYEILTGRPPYLGDDPLAVAMQVVEARPEPPSQLQPGTDRGLEAICLKCLSKDPADRYTSAAALAEDLSHWLAGEPISVRPPSTSRQVLEWLRKHSSGAIRLLLIGVVSALLMSMSAMMVVLPQVMASCDRSLDMFPSVSKPILLRVDWNLLNDVNQSFWVAFPIIAFIVWIMQGPLILLLLRPRSSGNAMALGLGCGAISGITASFCGVSQVILLALVIVPHIVVIRDVSMAAIGSDEERSSHRADLLSRIPDLKMMDESKRGASMLPYLVTMQIQGIFEGIFLSAMFVLFMGLTTVASQTLVAYYLHRREKSWWNALIFYVEFVFSFIVMLTYPVVILINSDTNLWFDHLWLWLILSAGLGMIGVVQRWRFAYRISLYILCYLAFSITSIDIYEQRKLAMFLYIIWMMCLIFIVCRYWAQERMQKHTPIKQQIFTAQIT